MEHHRRGAPATFDRRAPVAARALAGWRGRESRPFGTIGASACRPASAGGAAPRARESGLHGRAHRSHARRGRVLRRSGRGRGPSPPTRRRRSVLDHGTTVRARGRPRRLTGRDCGQAVGARPVVRARARLERGVSASARPFGCFRMATTTLPPICSVGSLLGTGWRGSSRRRSRSQSWPCDAGGSALDLGTGCGIQALLAAKHSERVVATDVNERALAFAAFNAR